LGKARGFYNLHNTPSFGFIDISYNVPSSRVDPAAGSITSSDYVATIKRGSTITVNGNFQYIINNDVIFTSDSSTATDQSIMKIDDNTYTVTKKDVLIIRGRYE
jgi:hypothetical protein